MSTRSTFLILTAATCAVTLHAEDAGKNNAAPAYQLKNKSSFDCPDTVRPPFWPVGWAKRQKGVEKTAAAAPVVILEEKNFALTSVLLGNPSLAVINGRAYGEGETVRGTKITGGAKVLVGRITDGTVELQCGGQALTIALRRAELSLKAADKQPTFNLEQ